MSGPIAHALPALTAAQIAALDRAAHLAPSADNSLENRFQADPAQGYGLSQHSARTPVVARPTLNLLSLGAAFENVRLQASQWGLEVNAAEPAEGLQRFDLLLLRIGASSAVPDKLVAEIERRHTNRRPRFHGPAVEGALRASFDRQVGTIAGAQLHWLDAPQKRFALGLIRLAEAQRFHVELLHRELFSSVNLNQRDAGAPDRHGIPCAALELNPLDRLVFGWLRHWPLQKALNTFGFHQIMALKAAYLPCRLAPQLGVISADPENAASAFSAGRLLQRAWLAATAEGLAFQVFAASPLYAAPGARGISPALQQRLSQGWSVLLDGRQASMVFRIGRAAAPSCTAVHPAS